jgi:hypothetical protein
MPEDEGHRPALLVLMQSRAATGHLWAISVTKSAPSANPPLSPPFYLSLHFANPLSTDYSLVPSPKYRGIIRNCAMKSAAEYRAYAEQCIESAKTARSQEERDALLEMARAWIEQAHQVEDSSTVQKPAKPEPR